MRYFSHNYQMFVLLYWEDKECTPYEQKLQEKSNQFIATTAFHKFHKNTQTMFNLYNKHIYIKTILSL